jgi:putative methyltransferase (TIGR04325 family)
MQQYENFESALQDSDSYEDPRIIDAVLRKTKHYREALVSEGTRTITNRQTVQNLFVFSCVNPDRSLGILEVGGACGASYFEMRAFFPGRIGHWSIVETPAMVRAGQQIGNEAALSFHSDFASAISTLEQSDLAIAQGVLQYSSDPLQMMEELFRPGFSYVYVTRMPAAIEPDMDGPLFTKQITDVSAHGPGRLKEGSEDGRSSQPLTIVSLKSIGERIPAAYELLYRFDESDDRILSIGGRSVTVREIGFLARRVET